MDLPELPVNEILERLNNIVKKINLGRLRMSLNVAKISNNEIEISAAAMPPTYLYKAKTKKCEEIMIEGLPLGGLKNEKFQCSRCLFKKEMFLLCYQMDFQKPQMKKMRCMIMIELLI